MDFPLSAAGAVVMGVIVVLFRRQVAEATVEMNYRVLGIRFNQRRYEISFMIGGSVITLLGILEFCGVLR